MEIMVRTGGYVAAFANYPPDFAMEIISWKNDCLTASRRV